MSAGEAAAPRVLRVPRMLTDDEQASVDAWPLVHEHIAAAEACGSLFRVRINAAHDHALPEGFGERLFSFIRANWYALDGES